MNTRRLRTTGWCPYPLLRKKHIVIIWKCNSAFLWKSLRQCKNRAYWKSWSYFEEAPLTSGIGGGQDFWLTVKLRSKLRDGSKSSNIAPNAAGTTRRAAALTVLDAETGSPLFEGHLFVFVCVALLEETGGAVLHGHQRDTKRGQLRVGQEPAGQTDFDYRSLLLFSAVWQSV